MIDALLSFRTHGAPGTRGILARVVAVWLIGAGAGTAQEAAISSRAFTEAIRPLLQEFCLKCHSTEKQKGELDLERFATLDDARKHPKVWQSVVEQLVSNEMPPKDKLQPSATQRQRLVDWANGLLDEIALARAGDPGPVVLRRLSNAEYTYSIRDLTGVTSLDPAREFPADSASGEGFMNVGQSLVMSPSLVTKYLDAAKVVASHAMLLPDGLRFSPKNSRRDWTEEILTEIRSLYGQFTINGGGLGVNLQGIRFDTKDGGVVPLEKYFAATVEMRDALAASGNSPDFQAIAGEKKLSPKYLATVWHALTATNTSLLLDPLRARWRSAKTADAAALADDVTAWQQALWKFNSVGHIGKLNGPKSWMEAVTPVQSKHDVRLKLSSPTNGNEIVLYLSASDAGDGNAGDFVVWSQPRFVAPGRSPLFLRDVRDVSRELSARRDRTLARTADYLGAASEAGAGETNVAALARQHGLETDALATWLNYLGLGLFGPAKIEGHFTGTFSNVNGYAFITGWGGGDTPHLTANSSDQHVRVPGNMKPHSIAVHPSPKLAAAVGWRSPMAGRVRVAPVIQHSHPECGNGVTWSLEIRRGSTRQRLANGVAQGGKEVRPPPIENLAVQPGDVVSLLIGPRDGNHSCDLTAIDLTVTPDSRLLTPDSWDLAKDVSPDVRAGNPHADRFGNAGVWHFYTEPDKGGQFDPAIPAGSLLAKWQATTNAALRKSLANAVQALLTSDATQAPDPADLALHQQLTSLSGPLFQHVAVVPVAPPESRRLLTSAATNFVGLDPALFGRHPDGSAIDPASLCVQAPSVIEVRVPADLVTGYEFVTTGALHPTTGTEGSVQLQVLTNRPAAGSGLLAIRATTADGEGPWYSNNRITSHNTPIVVNDGSAARRRVETDFDVFRRLFPAALCYTKIVPVDEVVTLTLYYREDEPFKRLMLDDAQAVQLDRLWDELHYVSHDALTLVDAYEQLWQYATQDADPKVFEPLREPIQQRAVAFRKQLTNTQPRHLDAAIDFAHRAYRRALTDAETRELRSLYRSLREQELPHEDAIRLTLARVLVAPAFLYRAEQAGPGDRPGPVNEWELATRLSYFLWSSAPDAELREVAASGRLRDPDVLAAQTRRMLRDPRVRRLATEFACAWLHVYDFHELGEKSERHFPTFTELRGAMYEETIRFFTDLFQCDGSVLDILGADYAFVNDALATHYGLGNAERGTRSAELPVPRSEFRVPSSPDGWRRVEGVRKLSRGGVLGQATTLAKQSGASRTSPILRGNWIAEVLLGEKLPRPPKDVPRLPEDEATETLTVRELTERHSSDPKCFGCHRRIDPYGYALEGFDAIGRRRERDLGGRPIDTRTKAMDGAEFDGLDGLRDYLLTQRRDAFLKQFCRKLLGYALGRGVLLSDTPLLTEMRRQLAANGYRVGTAIESIVRSRQFREIRGRDMSSEE